MSKVFEKAKKYYEEGRWTRRYLEALVDAGKLTPGELELIVSTPSEES